MIDREQVLHVARLARLELSEEEIERMSGELSGILEHVDRITALDLDDVEPTSHVVALENVLRADEPDPSLDRESRARKRTRRGRRDLPSALPAGRVRATELLDLTAAEAIGRIAAGRSLRRRVLRRLRGRRSGRRAQRLSMDG